MFPLEVPGLLGGILYQRPLRLREWLRKAPVAFPLFSGGLRCPGVRLRAKRQHRAGIPPSVGTGAVLLPVKTFNFRQAFRAGVNRPVFFADTPILVGRILRGSNLQLLDGPLVAGLHRGQAQVLIHLQALLAGMAAD